MGLEKPPHMPVLVLFALICIARFYRKKQPSGLNILISTPVGNIVRLKTRAIYKTIQMMYGWDNKFNYLYYHETVDEILFWRHNCKRLNSKSITSYSIPRYMLYSDASGTGCGGIFYDKHSDVICYKNFNDLEGAESSTWRELESIKFALQSFGNEIRDKALVVHTDNYAASLIVDSGSNKIHLQKLALDIYDISNENRIDLKVKWIPRDENVVADIISKNIDHDDWEITTDLFSILNENWGPISIDRFADQQNTKLTRFNSKYHCPKSEGVDAFTKDWSNQINLLVPPVFLIPKTIRHLLTSKKGTVGILVAPLWPSASYWPMISPGGEFYHFVKEHEVFGPEVLRQGNSKGYIGSQSFRNEVIAFKIVI